ncbi:MAG: hypothetical protein FWC96_03100 [Oscillospiraceae bacterium]|nr:hypothetical protein [Oscillospiraceae bacterium]
MDKKDIHVKAVGDKWGVELRDMRGKNTSGFIKMQSKEDAVRYARVCEQRTGSKVSLPK